MTRVKLTGYKNSKPTVLIYGIVTRAFTLEQFQDARIRYIENTKHYYDHYETTMEEV